LEFRVWCFWFGGIEGLVFRVWGKFRVWCFGFGEKEHRAGVGVCGGFVVEEKRGVVGLVARENRVQRPLPDLEPEHADTLVQGSGFRVQGSGFGAEGSGFRVQG